MKAEGEKNALAAQASDPPNASHSTHGKNFITHRFSIMATLLVSASLTIVNVYIGHQNLHYFRKRHRRHYRPNHDAPHIQRRGATIANGKDEIVHDGKYITQLLRGEKKLANTVRVQRRLKYRPGTLQMSSNEALRRCHVNMTQYANHFLQRTFVFVSMSENHKLIYRNVPKSASSSSRHAMENVFGGADKRMKPEEIKTLVRDEGYHLISFIRDPLERFYSSYDEAYFRKGPWFGEGRLVRNRPGERNGYFKTKHKVDPYPYLYEGMETYDDYRDKFCDKKSDKECKTADTVDDGDLTRRFERFVNDYNGVDPFDIHLGLQVPFLFEPQTGEPLPVSMLYNASNAEVDWLKIANDHDVQVPDNGLIHEKRTPWRINIDLVMDATKQKNCKMMMLDYCCLNLELPEVCKQRIIKDEAGDSYSCALERHGKQFFILPWNNL
ncbi:hypothetical protein ACHAW6_001522 [Cyclotella cf. meneghiniana]